MIGIGLRVGENHNVACRYGLTQRKRHFLSDQLISNFNGMLHRSGGNHKGHGDKRSDEETNNQGDRDDDNPFENASENGRLLFHVYSISS